MKKYLEFLRGCILFVAIFVFSTICIGILSGAKMNSPSLIPMAGFTLTIIIVFVWSKISKKYL